MQTKTIAFGAFLAVATAACAAGLPAGYAGADSASAQDRQFLVDTTQDTTFEILTGRLALRRTHQADVKAFAHQLIRDHEQLRPLIRQADAAAGLERTPSSTMTATDLAAYETLKGLNGDAFDQVYIRELVKGNQKGAEEAKAEMALTALPVVKSLAQRRLDLDRRHADAAMQLAQAHNVQP